MRSVAAVVNGICAALGAGAIALILVVWPWFAGAAPTDGAGCLRDAGFCFGPLVLPLLVAFSASAVHSAVRGDRDAARLNRQAVAAWAVAAGLVATVCAA